MLHQSITPVAWHQTATARRLIAQLGAEGFPSFGTVTRQGIWSDERAREYDREDARVIALMAVRDAVLELTNASGVPVPQIDYTEVDDAIAAAEQRAEWIARFTEVVEAQDTDYPASTAWSAIEPYVEVEADPVEAALVYCAVAEVARLARIAAFRVGRAA